jgi:hypothetical protein
VQLLRLLKQSVNKRTCRALAFSQFILQCYPSTPQNAKLTLIYEGIDLEKVNRIGLPLQRLLWYEYADEKIVTRDDTWVLHNQPETKRASMQWKHPSSP